MFKNLTVFKYTNEKSRAWLAASIQDGMDFASYQPIGPAQEASIGWVPPRGHTGGPLIEWVAGVAVARLMIETKSVPAATLQEHVDKACAEIERVTGRKPGKKERRDLKDEARASLLPHAFPRRSAVWVVLDPANEMLLIDSASSAVIDEALTALVKCADGMRFEALRTATSPVFSMTSWLNDPDFDLPDSFAILRSCELKSRDESKATVRYKNHPLDTDEVRQHIAQGKQAVKLALQYDDRVSFTLDASGSLSGITFADVVFDGNKDTGPEQFDADVTLAMGELKPLVADLIDAMGGEAEEQAEDQKASEAA